jgi:hypothetical protein
MKFYTMGVYNSTEHEFFNKLTENQIDTFCDIRQRRGVRGAKYAFVNSKRLQKKLAELQIDYLHVLELAPPKDIRSIQSEADKKANVLKRSRNCLSERFVQEYKAKVLNNFSFDELISQLQTRGASRVAFFCVEEHPAACHRSLVSHVLEDDYEMSVMEI